MTPELSIHPYLRAGWKQETPALTPAIQPALPDVNPADTVVQRMRAKLVGGNGGGTVIRGVGASGVAIGGGGGPSGGNPLTVGAAGWSNSGGWGGGAGSTTADINDLQAAATTATAAIAALDAKITGASISASCNGDGTITVTLTWG